MTRARRTGWRRAIALATGLSILALSAANATGSGDVRGEAPDQSLGSNAGYGVAAFLSNIVYAPLKLVVALGGSLASGVAWAFSGGDSELADSIIRPSVTGDYVITPDHLRGFDTVELLGGTRADDSTYYASDANALPPVGAGPPVPRTCDALPRLAPLRFALNESTLGSDQERVLSQVATTLGTCPERRFRLEGHADAQGEGPYNYRLSLQRAMKVKAYLIDEGVDSARLEAAGLGETDPASPNDTNAGRAANRRVELRVE
jgi:outer membrane protein OmpA-like peptidoglycan-associated protein